MSKANLSSFKRLSKYILNTNDLNNIKDCSTYIVGDKLETYTFTNCDFENAEDNVSQILATQKLNTFSKQEKTMHLIFSFQEDERPSSDILKNIEQDLCDALEMGHHQRLSAVHDDTNNYHVHLAINKVCPNTLKVKNPYKDILILQKAAALIEKKYGLKIDNHEKKSEQSEDLVKTNPITLLDHFEGWCKDKLYQKVDDLLKNETSSFKDLEVLLAKHDLKFVERRRGFVISSKSKKLFTKASSVHRGLSKTALEKRFTKIELSELDISNEIKFSKDDFKLNTDPNLKNSHWDDFKAAELLRSQKLKLELDFLEKKQSELNAKFKKGINKFQFNLLKKQVKAYRDIKKNIYKKYKYKSWREYLEEKAFAGDEDALKTLQYKNVRDLKAQIAEDALSGKAVNFKIDEKANYITKEGFVIYKDNDFLNKIIDKGNTIKVLYNVNNSEDVLLKSILIASKKYNNFLNINGTAMFKNNIIKIIAKHNLNIKLSDTKQNILLNNMKKSIHKSQTGGFKF